ncbi:hypothetical protein Bcp1_105 [Bacillus phage Bcp1]|uniref:Uncharacterized protein n=3 Tax=Caeruleovirus TaxID=1911929 RepID=A0A0S2MUF2_9CAUD|nr:hypothetical protein Bcp1_105 [Bacillus phage Bcp1]YP_009626664.1 hypothetical protein FD732_gp230 [Bacillus phage BM15]AHN66580.1 hypothetical protein Bcp1_105 [Bacillus phage Bcp1]ALO79519.1 hypothetical protein BM10_115 [Bacillus phage BM15]AXQ66870.1 hypothetical protein HOBO_112 [Bacillus phage Hobo]
MPTEHRCPNSGALIFVPTSSEKSTIQIAREFKSSKEELDKKLEDVDKLKEELMTLIAKAKEEK